MNDDTFEWTDEDGDRLKVEPVNTASGDWWVTLIRGRSGFSVVVRVPAVEVDRLVRCLRPDWAPPLRYSADRVDQSTVDDWAVRDYSGGDPRVVARFPAAHPDAEGAARAEAGRLNAAEVAS